MFRRGRGFFRSTGNPVVPPMLQRANQLMAAGDYKAATDAFTELAQRAENRFPRRAPFLFMAAGHAAILSDQTKIGVAHFKHGLTIFASQRRLHRMRNFGLRAIEELKSHQHNAEADELALLINSNLPKEISTENLTPKKSVLPTHCPSCGAAVRSTEVEWLDEVTAECDYCGSPIRGE
jgi:hypothetical protein